MIRTLYIVLTLMFCATAMYAQADSAKVSVNSQKNEKPEKRFKKVYWGLKAGAGQMLWDNDMTGFKGVTLMPMNGGLFIEYRPVKYVGIETGVNYFIGSFEGSIDAYSTSFKTVDSEGDNVEYRFSVDYVVETQELALVNVPVALKLNAFAGNWEFFAKGGMEYRHALTATYEQTGRATNQAYYEQWDLLIDYLPSQGFYTNKRYNEEGDILWKAAFEPFVGGGIVFPSRKTSFFIEGIYYLGSADHVEKMEQPFVNKIGNIPSTDQYSGSIMEMGSSTSFSGFIINIGLRF